jgi:hypothetical protein
MKAAKFDPEVAAEIAEASQPTGVNEDLQRFLATPAPRLPLSDLSLYHKNPRRGDLEALKESLLINSQYKPVVVNRGSKTGRPNEVLAGNHTVMALRELAEADPELWQVALVHMVDVDDVEAARIVAADNRIGDKGKYDEEILGELLSSIPNLEGTGYTTEELEKLLGNNVIEGDADTTAESRVFGVIVECETEAQQVALIDQLEGEGFTTRALM